MERDIREKHVGRIDLLAPVFDSHNEGNARSLFQAVWDSAVDAMALSDPNGIVMAANPAYCALYGYREEDVVGQSFAIIFPEEERAEAVTEYRRYFTERVDPQGVESPARRRDGTELLVDVRYNFLEHEGERVAMLSVIRDITERVQLREVERRFAQEKVDLLLAVSHDLKNPLTAIRGQAQLLLRRGKNSDSRAPSWLLAGAEQILTTAIRMTSMIEGLMDASSARRREDVPLHRVPVDLLDVVEQVSSNRPDAGGRGRIEIVGEEGLVGHWDETRVVRVVDNLLSNALKYSPESEPVIVSLRREERDSTAEAVLQVVDRGIGIPQTDIDRVFTPFFRGTNVDEGTPGMGIGLNAVRQIVQMHGGSTAVESEEGSGTVFTVRLPLHPADPPEPEPTTPS